MMVGFLSNPDVQESHLRHTILYTSAYSEHHRQSYPVEGFFNRLSRSRILQDLAQQDSEVVCGLLQLGTSVPSPRMGVKWWIGFAPMS